MGNSLCTNVQLARRDICLGLLKKISKKREDLRILLSASIPAFIENLSNYFGGAPIYGLDDSTYPIDVHYVTTIPSDYVSASLEASLSIADASAGDTIAIFLPSKDGQILERKLMESPQAAQGSLRIFLVTTTLDLERAVEALEDSEQSSNIIITSLQADLLAAALPVRNVIDSGFQELKYSKYSFATLAKTEPISQEVGDLRMRIAGLTGPGKCYRLYTKETFESLRADEIPEIQRLSLDHCILQLKSLGVDNVLRFDYLTPPPAYLLAEAMDRLASIGAIDDYARLTKPFGERLAQLPLNPLRAELLLKSAEQGCFDQILSLVASTLTREDYFDHEKSAAFIAEEGDALTHINILESFSKMGNSRTAWCRKNGLNEQRLSSAVHNRKCGWVIFEEAVELKGHIYIKNLTVVERDWVNDK
ncbi:hypothetical protein ABW19_dt0204960 [Dactylella cylindrospora]|nr:hypothetical protein ABW19_dt0204960 [Dactylella cylindrospora]